MARGRPALWSAALGAPLLAVGVYLFALQSQVTLLPRGAQAPPTAGAALGLFGVFVVGLGLYVEYVAAPAAPKLRPEEYVVDQRDPAQRNALAQATLSLPLLGVGFYLLYFTEQPYLVAGVPLAVGLYLFSTGLHRYWRNTLTTYIVTSQRVMEEYRFLSLVRNEVPVDKVRAVEERQSLWDSLFGLGRVYVRAGATGDLTISAGDVYESTPFADEIRAQLGEAPERGADPDVVDARPAGDEPSPVEAREEAPGGNAGNADNADAASDIVAEMAQAGTDGAKQEADEAAEDPTDGGSRSAASSSSSSNDDTGSESGGVSEPHARGPRTPNAR